jgi:hypothetical protein
MSNPVQREWDRQSRDHGRSNPYVPGDIVETPYAREQVLVVKVDDHSVWVKSGYLEKCRVLLDLVESR